MSAAPPSIQPDIPIASHLLFFGCEVIFHDQQLLIFYFLTHLLYFLQQTHQTCYRFCKIILDKIINGLFLVYKQTNKRPFINPPTLFHLFSNLFQPIYSPSLQLRDLLYEMQYALCCMLVFYHCPIYCHEFLLKLQK